MPGSLLLSVVALMATMAFAENLLETECSYTQYAVSEFRYPGRGSVPTFKIWEVKQTGIKHDDNITIYDWPGHYYTFSSSGPTWHVGQASVNMGPGHTGPAQEFPLKTSDCSLGAWQSDSSMSGPAWLQLLPQGTATWCKGGNGGGHAWGAAYYLLFTDVSCKTTQSPVVGVV